MKIQKTFSVMLMVVLLLGNIVAQTNSTIKQPEISPELRKNAVEFLRQTIKEIPNLKAEENRQFFMIETARLLWKYDEKEARAMFQQAIIDFKQALAKTNAKYKTAVAEAKKAQANSSVNYGANGYYANAKSNSYYANTANTMANFASEPSFHELGMTNEFRKVIGLRKKIINSLIDTDPYLAYQFSKETAKIIPDAADMYGNYSDFYSQQRIIYKLLEKGEIDKAIEVSRDSLGNGLTDSYIYTLISIHEKDIVKGSALAEETLQKIKTLNATEIETDAISLFFETAVEMKAEAQPFLSDKSIIELAKLFGNHVLSAMDGEYYFYPPDYAKRIQKYAPREALKIMQKAKQRRTNNANRITSNSPYYNTASNMPYYPANTAANMPYYPSNTMANSAANSPKPKTIPTPQTSATPPITYNEFENEYELMQKLEIGKFTADERKKVIESAKKHAIEENRWGYARPDGFILVVVALAKFSLISADKEVADVLMKEAEVYVRPENKTYLDYVGKLALAGGYSRHQPDKSFALVESMATINEVIESAVKLGGFVDVGLDLMPNGEASAPALLGDWEVIGGISPNNELPMFIQNLAKADFQRTKGLADKFDRNEVKMAAKILILNSLLGEKNVFMRGF